MSARSITKAASAVVVVALALALGGCRGGPTMDPAEAKRTIVEVVEQTTAALGGDWTVDSGPGLGICPHRDGGRGVVYVYIVNRDGVVRAADLDRVEALWQELGMTTERWESGGADPDTGVTGRGGPVSSIDFDTGHGAYTIDGSSPCAAGDFDEMVDTDPDE